MISNELFLVAQKAAESAEIHPLNKRHLPKACFFVIGVAFLVLCAAGGKGVDSVIEPKYLATEEKDGEVTVTGITGTVVIPETVNGLPVTAIGKYAFLVIG